MMDDLSRVRVPMIFYDIHQLVPGWHIVAPGVGNPA